MKKINLIMSTILFCGLGLFTACSEKDNVAPETVTSTDRAVFEKQFSKDLQVMADEFRFEAAMQTTASVKEFIDALDEVALSRQAGTILGSLIGGLNATPMDMFPDEEREAIIANLKGRYGMTDEDIQTMPGILIVDAYKSIGKMKLEFKDGQCTITNDADAFTIVNTNSKGETRTLAFTFNDERDGIRFLATPLARASAIAIQLPKSIDVTLTTPQGKVVNGTVNLTTIDPAKSQFVNFKESGWVADGKLVANVNNRQEAVDLYVKHAENGAFDLKAAFEISGKEMARIEVNDMHDAYTDEEINSETFLEMREMGPFFSGAYDMLKALKGKSVDNVVIAINDNLVIGGKVDDIAKALLALGNVRKLHGTKPGKEVVDQYTQQLNAVVHFVVSQKNTGVYANGSLVTVQKEQRDGEYQPAVALQFEGEKQPQAMFDRMSQTDYENYKKMLDSFSPLITEISETLIVARKKGEAIAGAVKDYFKF
jgi:hypothetical protein